MSLIKNMTAHRGNENEIRVNIYYIATVMTLKKLHNAVICFLLIIGKHIGIDGV